VAVGGGCSGELFLGLSNKRLEGLQGVLGEVLERLDNWEHKRARELGVDGHGDAARLWAIAQRTWPASFYPLYRCAGKAVREHLVTAWARHGLGGGNVRRTEQPVVARRVRTGECGHTAWHRPRGLARVTPP
jgi:hypothetical protein